MSWRFRRQLVILIIAIAFFAALVALIVPQFLSTPSCFDNKKNQGELEVDCGGLCTPCELRSPKSVTVYWSRLVSTRPNVYDAVAEIENQNEVLASPELLYEFSLFDDFGPVAVRKGTTFILPQERMHIIETGIETSREPTRVSFRILNPSWNVGEGKRFNLVVEQKTHRVEGTPPASIVESTIINRTAFGFREVEVRFIALDSDRNLLGSNTILVDRFLSGSRRVIRSLWPEAFQDSVATIIVEPRVNIFDPDVILKPQ